MTAKKKDAQTEEKEVESKEEVKTTEVAVKAENAVAEVSFLDELAADAEEFKEALSQDDMSVPFLVILQALSPACTEGDPGYIEGARPGMLYNTVSGETYDVKKKPLKIIPIAYKSSYIEWIPRSSGKGGFVTEHSTAEGMKAVTVRNDDNEDIIQQNSPVGQPGNQMAYTHTHFVFVMNEETGDFEPFVLTMASSQIKHSKKFNRMVNNLKLPNSTKAAPRFFGIWEVSTELETKGDNKWQSWAFKKFSDVIAIGEHGRDIYQAAKTFSEGIRSGDHKVDYAKAASEVDENPSVGDAVPTDGEFDSEIPF